MPVPETILLLGATGRTGGRVLRQLLARGVRVRAIVRSVGKLPAEVMHDPMLTVVDADLASLADVELQRQVRGCAAVVSCLGHVISLAGLFGPPRDLVTSAVARVCRAIESNGPAEPVKVVLMSSVSVHRPGALDARRTSFERAFLWLLRCVLPPVRDNQRAADYLAEAVGASHAHIEWVAVRPDTLLEGEVSEYAVHPGLVNGVFAPGATNMANVAHFMCQLVTDQPTWEAWKGKLPVIVNAAVPSAHGTRHSVPSSDGVRTR